MVIDYKSIAKQLNLDETEVKGVVQKLIKHKIIEYKGDSVKPSFYRYRLNSNFGWKKSFDWIFPNGIDWQAFLTSFQKLQRKFELRIKAIENKSGGILVIHLEVSALANRTEVQQRLKHEYKVELKDLQETYRIKHSNQEIAIHQQNSTNLLKIIELIVNTNNNLHNRVDIKAKPQSESVKPNLSHNNITNQGKTTKNSPPIAPKRKQTLAEAVAEREKLSKQLDSTEVDRIVKVDDSIATQDIEPIVKVDDSIATQDIEPIVKVDDSIATQDIEPIAKVDDSIATQDVEPIAKSDDSLGTQDHNSFLKRKIKARLNKHCH
ncbi:MAG: hypothetical protein AB4206_02605 [Xenococcaceae cyanobacterium]